MKTEYFEIPEDNWGVVLVYDYDIMDWYDLEAIMESFKLPKHKIKEALKVLSNLNTGMTISRYDIRMSVVFISDATSEEEWWNTAAHESKHVADAIIDYYNVVHDSEDAAYLTGFMMEQLINLFGEPCRYDA